MRCLGGHSTYPVVTSTGGSTLHSLNALVPTYGPGGCPSGVRFNLSNPGGTTWYGFNGYVWQTARGMP